MIESVRSALKVSLLEQRSVNSVRASAAKGATTPGRYRAPPKVEPRQLPCACSLSVCLGLRSMASPGRQGGVCTAYMLHARVGQGRLMERLAVAARV